MKIKYKGPSLDPSGYGEAVRDYIKALHSIGVDITVEPWNFEAKSPSFYGEKGELIESLKNRNIDYDIVIHHYVPGKPAIEKDKINIGYNTWETDRLPSKWTENINNFYDMNLVPSEFNKEVYAKSGVKIPIEVVPHCLDVAPYENAEPMEITGFEDHFKFLSVFQWTERKNPIGLLKAYYSEFTNKDKVVLILKTYRSNTSREEVEKIKQQIDQLKLDMKLNYYPPVYLLSGLLVKQDMYQLYKASDCFVLPTRGEGFGIPFAEACAGENLVITTDFGGQTDFLSPLTSTNSAMLAPCFYTPVAHMPWIPNYDASMRWAEPDLESIRVFMSLAYEMGTKRLNAKKYSAHQFVKEELSYKRVGDIFVSKLKKALGGD